MANPLLDIMAVCKDAARALGFDVTIIGPMEGKRVKAVFVLRDTPAKVVPLARPKRTRKKAKRG